MAGRLSTVLLRKLRRLSATDRERVSSFVDSLLGAEQAPPPPRRGRKAGATWYRLEMVRCGKQACKKCAASEGHGPYWYAYFRKNGKMKSRYIGKNLAEGKQRRDSRLR